MKKNFIYLLLLFSLIAQAQVTPSYPTIKLTKTTEGVKQDSLLVIGTDKTVKHIPYSKISSVQEYATASALPVTGVAGKIYITKDNNKIYTWNGTFYSEFVGAKGEKGDQGVAGIVGAKGDQGIQGPQGPQGIQGLKGDPGLQGDKGDKGDQGIQGIQGLKGDTGAKGDTGSFNGDLTADQVTETATRKFQTATQSAYNDATSSIQGQLNSKENTFSKNTAFNKNFGKTAGTVVEGGTLGSNAYSSTAYLPLNGTAVLASSWGAVGTTFVDQDNGNSNFIMTTSGGNGIWKYRGLASFKSDLGLGSNAYSSTVIPTNTNQLTNGSGYITDISGKVDKVTGKSLISDSEITRLATVTNQDISGKANKDGTNASGTWGISISGNASSATNWGGSSQFQDADNGNSNYIMVTTGGTGFWKYRPIGTFKTDLGLGSNAYTSTPYLPLSGGILSGNLNVNSILRVGDDSFNSTIDQAGIGKITSEFTGGKSYTKFFGHTGSTENYLILSIDGLGNSTFTGTVTATSFNGSATLTGTPTAPTATAGTNTTQIATTAFVQNATITSGTITTATNITTATTVTGGESQRGKTILIANGASNINYTINAELTASFVKGGTGTITFVQGSGRTLVAPSGLIFNGIQGSTASVTSFGTTDYVYINNF